MYGPFFYAKPYFGEGPWVNTPTPPTPPVPPVPPPTPIIVARSRGAGRSGPPPTAPYTGPRPETRDEAIIRQDEEARLRREAIEADDADVLEIIAAITKTL